MKEKIFSFLKKPTSINIAINTLGNYLNVFFTAVFAFLLVRMMKPEDYGVLSVLLSVTYLFSNIFDFGITANIYGQLPLFFQENKNKAFKFLKTIFYYQLIFLLLINVILLFTIRYIDYYFLKTQSSFFTLSLVILTIIFFVWQNFFLNVLNSIKKFYLSNLYLNLSNIIKLIFLIIFFLLKKINPQSVIFTFGVVGPLTVFLLIFYRKKEALNQILKSPIEKKIFSLKFTFTFFLASQIFNLAQRIDLLFLSFYFPKSALLGYYGLAQKIILTVIASVISITQVLSPQYALIKTKKETIKLFKTSFIYLSLPTFLFVILAFLPDKIFTLFFTEKYFLTSSITHRLSWPFIFYNYLHIPFLFLLYSVKKTEKIFVGNLIFFLTSLLGAIFLTQKLNVFAPAVYYLFSYFLILFVNGFFVYQEIKKLPN